MSNRYRYSRAFHCWSQLPPQEKVVLNHLIKVGSISSMEAHTVHRIRSLSRRITSLVDSGVQLIKEDHRDVTGQRYRRYTLVHCPAELRPYGRRAA